MTPQEILSPTFDPALLQQGRIIPDMPFTDYQRLPGVNASLLKNATTYEMLSYAVGMAALDDMERMLAERSGDSCAAVLERVEQTTPRTVPVKMVHLARNVLETDKLSPAQKEIVEALRVAPMDSREVKSATLVALDNKGLLRWTDEERSEIALAPAVKESRAQALAIGDATHKAILEPHMFDSDEWQKHWVLSPTKGLTTTAALARAAENPCMELITPEIVDTARRCRDAVWKHKLAAELLREGQSEVTAQAWDEDAGCWRKARLDRLPTDPSLGIVDIKTTHKGLLHQQIKSSMYSFGYGMQAAYYMDTLAAIEGKPREHFHMIFVTKEAPFLARCVELNTAPMDESFVIKGRELYLERLAMFAVAWNDQQWEAYENEPLTTLRA
jgi:hypothetical protein